MSDQLHQGELLRRVIQQANDQSIWVRGPQLAFCGWAGALDAWMRNQLAGAVDLVRQKVEAYVSAYDNAQQAFANGIPGVVQPPPPPPVGAVAPTCPYPFDMQVPKGTNPTMNPDLMRKALVPAIGKAKEEVHAFSTRLGDILTEPTPVPGAPPMHHLPPDAKEAAGVPSAFQAIALELQNALDDVLDRAQAWEEAQAADNEPSSAQGLGGFLQSARDAIARIEQRAEAAPEPAPSPALTPEAEAPAVDVTGERAPVDQPPPNPEESRKAADDLVRQYPPNDKTLDDPKRIEELSNKLRDHVPNPDPVFAARFVERFGAKPMIAMGRSLQAWQQGWDKFRDRSDNNQRGLGVGKAYDKATPEEIQGAIYSFSATLATATTSGSLPDKVEEDLLKTNDPLALSWLLSDPNAKFDPVFLVRAFDKCVKNTIIIDASHKGQPWQDDFRSNPGLVLTGSVLSHDPKIAALEAISRNPEAALRLQREFKPFELRYGGGHGSHKVESLADLLYRGSAVGRGYPDAGNSVGRTLVTIYDTLLAKSETDSNAGAEAQKLTGQMVRSASTTTLPNGARQGLGRILSGHVPNIAAIIVDPKNQLTTEFRVAEDFSDVEIKAAITEIAHDPKALSEVMASLGGWVEGTYNDLVKRIAQQPDPAVLDPSLLRDFKQENLKIGRTFCAVAHSVRDAGIKDREKAMATLAGFRFGVDIFVGAVKSIPAVGAVSGGLDKATAGAAGQVSGVGQEALSDKIASWMSGVDAEEEAAKSKAITNENVTALNGILFDKTMNALGTQPLVLHALLARDPAAKWPDAMLQSPSNQPPKSPVPTDPNYLKQYLKPEYVGEDGSVHFPVPGDPAYNDYRSWCTKDYNNVAGEAHELSDAASVEMHRCMTDVGWVDAA